MSKITKFTDTAGVEAPPLVGTGHTLGEFNDASQALLGQSEDTPDKVNPLSVQVGGSHYKEMPIQPLEFCHRNKIMPAETLAIRYICRHRRKNGREDIEKAIHCLQVLLELEYPQD